VFYPRYAWEIASKVVRFGAMWWDYWRIYKRVQRGPGPDMDIAMMPVREGDFDALEMFTATQAARSVVDKRRRKLEAIAAAAPIAAAAADLDLGLAHARLQPTPSGLTRAQVAAIYGTIVLAAVPAMASPVNVSELAATTVTSRAANLVFIWTPSQDAGSN